MSQMPNSVTVLSSFGKKVPMILQTEVAECGLACIAMIAGYYGYRSDLTTLRKEHSISSQGTNLKQLINIGGTLNLNTRPLKLTMEHLTELQLPCVLHWDLNHFVVLTHVGKKKVKINDPAIGERILAFDDVSKSFSGVALEATPSETFKKKKQENKLKLEHFWTRIVGLKRSLITIFILSFLLQVFALAAPFYLQTVIDDVVLRSDTDLLVVLALGFGLLMLVEVGTTLLRDLVILNFSSHMGVQMAANVFRHLIRLPMGYFAKRHIGDIVSRFRSLQTVRDLFTTKLVAAVIDGILAIFTLIAMFFYSKLLATIVLGIGVLYIVIRLLLYRPIRILTEEGIVAAARENTHFMESVRAIQTIKLFEKENDRQSQWQNRLINSVNKQIQLSKWNIGFDFANKLLFGIENIIIIYLAASAVLGNLISVGMLYAFMSYKNRFISSLNELISTWIEFKMLEVHLNRLADVVFTDKEERGLIGQDSGILPKTASQSTSKGTIEVNMVSYAYSPNDPEVLKDVSFKVDAGKSIAITGSSGCGKSTLIKCMMGLYQPTTGSILVDGADIFQQADYRNTIAGVLQDDVLLSGSILDNIACFDEPIDVEKAIQCAQMACVHEDIMAMFMQYNTLVGDMGDILSGGQKQRIILARALYRTPKILFMDEATSHLDTTNESLINKQIGKLDITRVIVAHRPETIKSADPVFHFKGG